MSERPAADWSARWSGGPGQWGRDAGPAGPNSLAVLGLVLGVVGCVASLTIIGGMVLGVLALGFAGVGRSRARSGRAGMRRVAGAGMLSGLLAVVLSVTVLAVLLTSSGYHHYQTCRRQAHTLPELSSCGHLLHYPFL